jgi:hypothetical protein
MASGSGDLAIVSCHFNPCNYRSRERNLLAYLDAMSARNLPVFVAELAFPNQSYVVPESSNTIRAIRFSANDVMWHKERLLNLAVQRLPERFTKVAWIDADVLFPDPAWYQKTSALLDSHNLIQLFDTVSQQDNDGRELQRLEGLAAYIAKGKPTPFKFDVSRTWPGLAWASKRQLFNTHGLLDRMILGGSDTYMSLAAFGQLDEWHSWHLQRLTTKLLAAWKAWAEPFFRSVQGKVGYLPGTIAQLGHGVVERRRYVERMDILNNHDFDPVADIACGPSGVWKWSTAKPAFHAEVRRYFEQRREDL